MPPTPPLFPFTYTPLAPPPAAFTGYMAALGLAPGCPDLLLDLAGLYKGRGLLAVRRGGVAL